MNMKIKCPCCAGDGHIEMTDDMQRTLDAVSFDYWRSTRDIFQRLNDRYVKVTAINNRLRSLEKEGLVKSQNRGRAIYWHRKPLALWRITEGRK